LSARLDRFLAATDLDELTRAAAEVGSLDPAEAAVAQRIATEGAPAQALSNLLMHPRVIQSPARLAALSRALDQTESPYFVLAAVVGLQSVGREELEEPTWLRLRDLLMSVLALSDGVIAERASVTLFQLARPTDSLVLVPYGGHANPVVRRNTLAMLLKVGDYGQATKLGRELATDGTLPPEVAAEVLEVTGSGEGMSAATAPESLRAPLLTRIPSYVEARSQGTWHLRR
jgi:hypothetical protein